MGDIEHVIDKGHNQEKERYLYLEKILGVKYMMQMTIAILLGRPMPDHDYYPGEDTTDPLKLPD